MADLQKVSMAEGTQVALPLTSLASHCHREASLVYCSQMKPKH